MFNSLKRLLEIALGTLAITVGLIGWILPIIPGAPLVLIGILLISPYHGKKIAHFTTQLIKKGLRFLKR